VLPITLAVLIALFLVQQRGTGAGGIGAIFGPVMLIWFSTLGLAGLANIALAPAILGALNPLQAVAFSWITAGSRLLPSAP
jgi:KUP system potassium uptake protein